MNQLPNVVRSSDGPGKNINNPRHAHHNHQLQTDTSQGGSVTNTNVCHFLFSTFSNRFLNAKRAEKKRKDNDKNHRAYRSVVDFTSSRFQRPQVSWRAVDRNSKTFTHNRIPMGPKKYARISKSPVGWEKKIGFGLAMNDSNGEKLKLQMKISR